MYRSVTCTAEWRTENLGTPGSLAATLRSRCQMVLSPLRRGVAGDAHGACLTRFPERVSAAQHGPSVAIKTPLGFGRGIGDS